MYQTKRVLINKSVARLYYAIHNVQQHAGRKSVNVCQCAWQVHREPELQCSKVEHQAVVTVNWLQISSASTSGAKYLLCVCVCVCW